MPKDVRSTIIIEWLHLVTYVQLVEITVKVKGMACTTIACFLLLVCWFLYTTRFNSKAKPNSDTNYSYHINVVELGKAVQACNKIVTRLQQGCVQ